ncbi:hypothetical protein [Yersinia massiliensis]|uniref:Uncharacterized protein n=1 Tax=Yersinia massiliensis TaxID=419257 RepID=A0ABM6USC8_9GAMM|nr:hypothetical protein [Yersinia massiliensis]AVX37812.1 hypothetical protein DA391_09140 [Yersinia massiliensis]
MQKGHQIGSLKSLDVMPALASVGFNRFTTFGWILFHNDWINQPSTHANAEKQKGRLSDLNFVMGNYFINLVKISL